MREREPGRPGLWERCTRACDAHPVAAAAFFAAVTVLAVSWALLDERPGREATSLRMWFAAALAVVGLVWALRRALHRDGPGER